MRSAALSVALSGALLGSLGCSDLAGPGSLEWITVEEDGFALAVTELDRGLIPVVSQWTSTGRSEVQAFFGRPYLSPYTVRVFPDRASLAGYWRDVWRAPGLDQGCATVAAARRHEVTLLSPAAWAEGCGKAPETGRVRAVLTHELVHVLHEQSNPDLGQIAYAMPWFVEGLAVYVSGQLRREYENAVRDLVASGYAPTRLAEIWEETLRYGIAGSVVQHIDRMIGRSALASLLEAAVEADVVAATGQGEAELLAGWRASVLAEAARSR
jgi:hypothetical protein